MTDEPELPRDDRSPAPQRVRFDCPHCGAFAQQTSMPIGNSATGMQEGRPGTWWGSRCAACSDVTLFIASAMVYPQASSGPLAHAEMPDNVRSLYDEARAVAPISNKSAAALLRLALQVIVDDLVPGRGAINDKIGQLVAQGVDPQMQQAMDIVRVIGNNGVHPGEIDLDAEASWVPTMFDLINFIVEDRIARPARVRSLFASLPPNAQAAVARRDSPPSEA